MNDTEPIDADQLAKQSEDRPENIECPQFDVHHFLMLVNKELTPDEAKELETHCTSCEPCQIILEEVRTIMAGRGKLTRTEALSFLRCLLSPLSTVLWNKEESFLNDQN